MSDHESKYKPFPVECLPEPLAGFVGAYSKSIGCDPVVLALPGLAVYGAAVGNSVRVVVPGKDDWKTPCVIWSMIVGDSGDHKSPALEYAVKPVVDLDFAAEKEYQERLRDYRRRKKLFEKAELDWHNSKECGPPPEMPEEPTQVRRMVDDATVEATVGLFRTNPRSLLLACDELGSWITSFDQYKHGKGKSDVGRWLSMYGARHVTVDRKSGDPKTIMVRNAYLCVTGGIQPGKLVRVMTPELREQGMLGRFLLACPPPTDDMWTSMSIPAEVPGSYAKSVEAIYEFPVRDDGQFTELTTNQVATALYIEFYNRNKVEAKGLCGDLRAAMLKLEEIPRRLAGIIHMIRWANRNLAPGDDATIDEKTMESAIKLTEWFKGETRRIYAEQFSGNAAVREKPVRLSPEQKLVEFIRDKAGSGEISVQTVYQKGPSHVRSAKSARAALQELVDEGVGEWSGDFTCEQDYFRLIQKPCDTSHQGEDFRASTGALLAD